ncbi:MAG: hypothetical protein MI866_07150, partial [Bacteroidales bacterium]|nr:hypothetical protein [Bacteroidales bacterium]
SDKFFSSLKFHQLKQQGYRIDDCLEEFAVSCLEAEGPLEGVKVEEREGLKSRHNINYFWIQYILPRTSSGNIAVDLSPQRLTSVLRDALYSYNSFEGFNVFIPDFSYADANGAQVAMYCADSVGKTYWEVFEFYSMVMEDLMFYFEYQLATSYSRVTGMSRFYGIPGFYYAWYNDTGSGCLNSHLSNDFDYLNLHLGGGGKSNTSAGSWIFGSHLDKNKAPLTPEQEKLVSDALKEITNKDYIGSQILDYIEQLDFLVDKWVINTNLFGEAGYDPRSGDIQFVNPNAIKVSNIAHELTHVAQEIYYDGRLTNILNSDDLLGYSNIEFEARIIDDLRSIVTKKLTSNERINREYAYFIIDMQDNGVPVDIDDLFFKFIEFFKHANPQYNWPTDPDLTPEFLKLLDVILYNF